MKDETTSTGSPSMSIEAIVAEEGVDHIDVSLGPGDQSSNFWLLLCFGGQRTCQKNNTAMPISMHLRLKDICSTSTLYAEPIVSHLHFLSDPM